MSQDAKSCNTRNNNNLEKIKTWMELNIDLKENCRKLRLALKSGKGTEFIIEDIKFDVKIPPYVFSKAALRR